MKRTSMKKIVFISSLLGLVWHQTSIVCTEQTTVDNNSYMHTIMINTIRDNDVEKALKLITAGKNYFLPDQVEIQQHLFEAVRLSRVAIVKALLDTNFFDVNQLDDRGQSLFYHLLLLKSSRGLSVKCGSAQDSVEVAKLLIAYGADVNQEDIYGFTPLYWAGCAGNEDIAHLVIDAAKKLVKEAGKNYDPVLDGLFN